MMQDEQIMELVEKHSYQSESITPDIGETLLAFSLRWIAMRITPLASVLNFTELARAILLAEKQIRKIWKKHKKQQKQQEEKQEGEQQNSNPQPYNEDNN